MKTILLQSKLRNLALSFSLLLFPVLLRTPATCQDSNVKPYESAESAAVPTVPPQIGYGTDPDADKKKTLLLKDFNPVSMLHAQSHEVQSAKFYVVDVHNHVNDAARIDEHMAPQRVIEVMDRTNVKTIVILTGMWGDKLQKVIDEMVKPYPGRFIVFTQIDWSKIDDANFSQEMVEQLDDAVHRGARGLKVLKDLGLADRDKTGKLIAVDDPRLDPIWEECGRLGIPVSIHVTDPEAFFRPVDSTNERYEELTEHPDWNFYGNQFPSKESIIQARDRVFARHPRTTFVALHMANWPENLDYVSSVLEKYPNVMVEFGAREAELGRQPRRAREFFLKHQDRIMFGTDNEVTEAMYRNHFRWLETNDEYFDYWGYPGQGRWKIYGMALPDSVLEKIYHLNAERMFGRFKN
ncbi:MAG: amidohydrolase [Acidobacteriota bacterium]|nr:amidohydrolase [Acidobacteriota bacterium]